MNRRNALKTVGSAAALAVLTPSAALGQATPPPALGLLIQSDILNNHGHEVVLNPALALEMLRETQDSGGATTLNIQGQSRHPHTITLRHEDLLDLFIEGEAEVLTSTDSGHQHGVNIRLIIG